MSQFQKIRLKNCTYLSLKAIYRFALTKAIRL